MCLKNNKAFQSITLFNNVVPSFDSFVRVMRLYVQLGLYLVNSAKRLSVERKQSNVSDQLNGPESKENVDFV